MKIAFVNQPPGIIEPGKHGGSLGVWTYEAARRLAREHDVVVFARRGDTQAAEETAEGVRIVRIGIEGDDRIRHWYARGERWLGFRRPLFVTGWYFRSYIRRVLAQLKGNPPDIIHVHNLSQFAVAARRAFPRARVLLHMHCEWLNQISPDIIAQRLKAVDRVLGCSDYIVRRAVEAHPVVADRTRTVYNGVDTDLFVPSAERRADTKQVLYVGRISPEKGVHDLIGAMASVRSQHPSAKLTIAGPHWATPQSFLVGMSDIPTVRQLARWYSAPYQPQLEALIERLRLTNTVEFAGLVPNAELPRLYQHAAVLVNPSLSEAFGMTLAEAGSCGLPAVATSAGGMTEVVDHGVTGLVVAPAAPGELAEAINRLLDDRSTADAYGRAARVRVCERFAWDKVVTQLERVYGETAK